MISVVIEMPEIILALGILCVILFGYCLMKKFDAFFADGRKAHPPEDSRNRVLLFGLSSNVSVLDALDRLKIGYDLAETGSFIPQDKYTMVFACSDNDIDNLLVCSSAKKTDSGLFTVAKCNDKLYETVFRRADVDKIVFDTKSVITTVQKTERDFVNDI